MFYKAVVHAKTNLLYFSLQTFFYQLFYEKL